MKALVTGASGFVGYAVAKRLLDAGFAVRTMVRNAPLPHLKELEVEMCQGNLRDKQSLASALEGCQYLFHVAAHYTLWEKDPEVFYQTNVQGTKDLVSIAADSCCERIVYTSSVATIKPSLDKTPANEDSIATEEDMIGHYKRSKYLAELEVEKLAANGAPVVIVNPSAPIGAYDVKPTPTGKVIVDYLKGKMFGYLDTGLNLVAVEDVAEGHLLALSKGKNGRRYILGDQNLTLIDLFCALEKITDIKAPNFRVPYQVAYMTGVASETWARLRNKTPDVPLDGVRMARKYMFFDSSRAIDELGYRPTSVEVALERAVQWFRENKYA